MSHSTRNLWAAAETISGAGELAALWLEGLTSYTPLSPDAAPDPRLEPMIPALAAASRAGLLTIGARPGHADDDGFGWARPLVEGFLATPDEGFLLRSVADDHGVVCGLSHMDSSSWWARRRRRRVYRRGPHMVVALRAGSPSVTLRPYREAAEIPRLLPGCSTALHKRVQAGVRVYLLGCGYDDATAQVVAVLDEFARRRGQER